MDVSGDRKMKMKMKMERFENIWDWKKRRKDRILRGNREKVNGLKWGWIEVGGIFLGVNCGWS